MDNRCQTRFEHTGNQCQREKGHPNGCYWAAANEPLEKPIDVPISVPATTSNDRHFSKAEVDALVAAERAEGFSTFLHDMLLLLGYTPGPDECVGQATIHKALDAKITAAVALIVQKAAEHALKTYAAWDCSLGWECVCGERFLSPSQELAIKSWRKHILALADQNAIEEHDAALRQELGDCKDALLVASRQLEEAQGEIETQEGEKAKLEAENAGLREALTGAITGWHYEAGHGSPLDKCGNLFCEKNRALLGEAVGPEGRNVESK